MVQKRYEAHRVLGQGTYGRVFLVKHTITKEKFAMKSFLEGDGVREMCMLHLCAHQNVVKLVDTTSFNEVKLPPGQKVSKNEYKRELLVFEFVPRNLLSQLKKLPRCQIKPVLKQLLEAINHCHSQGILHSDIKTDNILLDMEFNVKLADFGLATRSPTSCDPHMVYAVSLRAPELILGFTTCSFEADIWAAGCVFGDLLIKASLISVVEDEQQVLREICKLCGKPTSETWPWVSMLPEYSRLEEIESNGADSGLKSTVKKRLGKARVEPDALDLLEKMLVMNPDQRITAAQALVNAEE